jgi:hypothetical protein
MATTDGYAMRIALPILVMIGLSGFASRDAAANVAQTSCPFYGTSVVHPDLGNFNEFNKSRLGSLIVLQAPSAGQKGIDANTSIGAGFLIDRRSGLFLTAAHVVTQAIKGNKSPEAVADFRKELVNGVLVPQDKLSALHGRLASSLSKKIEFDAIVIHPTRDVAVIRASKSKLGLLRDTHPFELVFSAELPFRTPQAGVPRFAYIDDRIRKLMDERSRSTRSSDDEENYLAVIENRTFEPTWRQGRVTPESMDRFRLAADVIEGDSGGPVLLLNGSVLGIVHQQNLREELDAESLPASMQHDRFLKEALSLRRGDVLDLAERVATAGVSEWKSAFQPSNVDSYLSNLDIAVLVRELRGNPQRLPKLKQFLECAIVWAAKLRWGPEISGLPGVKTFEQLGSDEAYSSIRAQTRSINELRVAGAPLSAFVMAEQAAEALTRFMAARMMPKGNTLCGISRNSARAGIKAEDTLAVMGIVAPIPQANTTCQLVPTTRDEFSARALVDLFDIRRSQFELAKQHGYALPESAVKFGKGASVSPILATWLAQDDATKARAYEQLGGLFIENDQPNLAAKAYVDAFVSYKKRNLGDEADRALSGFSFSKAKETNQISDFTRLIQNHGGLAADAIQRAAKNPLEFGGGS